MDKVDAIPRELYWFSSFYSTSKNWIIIQMILIFSFVFYFFLQQLSPYYATLVDPAVRSAEDEPDFPKCVNEAFHKMQYRRAHDDKSPWPECGARHWEKDNRMESDINMLILKRLKLSDYD